MATKRPPKLYTQEQMDWARSTERVIVVDKIRSDMAAQKAQIDLDQARAVADLLRACSENLSKAGYLIGKLNKDTSR